MRFFTEDFGWIEDNRTPDQEPINQGEYQLKQWFRNKGHEVIDVSDNRLFFEPDIDLLVKHSGIEEPATPIEVKYDRLINKTGNLFVEYRHDSLSQGKQAGWFFKCRAKLLFYMDARNNFFYVFKYKEFKDYICKNAWKCKEVAVNDKNKYGVYGTSFGWLVPLKELEANIKVQKLYI